MFKIRFTPLLSVTVKHNFYNDLISKDFEFIPVPDTNTLLKAYSLNVRMVDGKLMIYQQLNDADHPFQPIDEIIDLYFTIHVNTDILNITENFGQGKYWFSNLKKDGSYSNKLTKDNHLTLEDVLPNVSSQTIRINFKSGTLSSILVKKLMARKGFHKIQTYDVDEAQVFQEVQVNQSGIYVIEKIFKDGSIEPSEWILHDDLLNAGNYWGVLHLQLEPNTGNKDYVIELKQKETIWQYLLIEPNIRSGPPIEWDNVNLGYSVTSPSRYPSGVTFNRKQASDYPESEYPKDLKNKIDSLKSSPKVKDVYIFESDRKLEILEGAPPKIKLNRGGQTLAEKMSIPTRSMKETKLMYNL